MFIRNEASKWIFKEDNIKYTEIEFSFSEDSENKNLLIVNTSNNIDKENKSTHLYTN